jgi:hypothetical protein
VDAQTIKLRISPVQMFCPECKSALMVISHDDQRVVYKHDDPHSYRDCPHRAKLLSVPVRNVEATVI